MLAVGGNPGGVERVVVRDRVCRSMGQIHGQGRERVTVKYRPRATADARNRGRHGAGRRVYSVSGEVGVSERVDSAGRVQRIISEGGG